MKPRESKPRSKCVWVHKDKGTEEKICLGPLEEESRPRKVNPGHVVEDFPLPKWIVSALGIKQLTVAHTVLLFF